MRAVTMRRFGPPEVLTIEELPTPEPGPGEVRIRVRAVGLNHIDVWIRRGIPLLDTQLPHVLGADVAGVVDALGPGARGCSEGDEVVLAPGVSCGRCRPCTRGRDNLCGDYHILGETRAGGYAEYIVVPDRNVFPKPRGLDFTQAAAVPCAFLTAWEMLVRRAELASGDWLLVHAAGSGVGSAAVQIAKWLGARVIATVGGEAKVAKAQALGADVVVDHLAEDVLLAARAATGGTGVDVVFEHPGQSTWAASIRALAPGGRVVTCGATSGHEAVTDLRYLFWKNLSLLGVTTGRRADLFDIFRLVESGALRPIVHATFPLHEAARAHHVLEDRAVFGKVLLSV